MRDERATAATTVEADGESGSRVAVEGVATPDDEEQAPPDHGPGLASVLQGAVDGIQPGDVLEAVRDDSATDGPRDWVLQVAVWTMAVLGFVLLFGVAVGGAVVALQPLNLAGRGALGTQLVFTGLLLAPVATFAFIAGFDDAKLVVPEWSGEHPPLVDAWLFSAGTAAVAVLTLLPPNRLEGVLIPGIGVSLLSAYLGVPFWLSRRCLRRPRWSLGGLTLLAAPLVVLVAAVSFGNAGIHGVGPVLALAVTAVGATLSYVLASASPGPAVLADRLGAALGLTAATARAVANRFRGLRE